MVFRPVCIKKHSLGEWFDKAYGDAIDESARLTEEQIELSEDEKQRLNHRLQVVRDSIGSVQEFSFTYFVPDQYKAGGAYLTCRGRVKRIDMLRKNIVLIDHTQIPIERITEIENI